MDEKEEALGWLLEALDKWEEALIDYGLRNHAQEQELLKDRAEGVLIEARREYRYACRPEPEPEPDPAEVCPHCEARWNEEYTDDIAVHQAADRFMAETLPKICLGGGHDAASRRGVLRPSAGTRSASCHE